MGILNKEIIQELIKLNGRKRCKVKNEIRKLKSENKRTFKLIRFCDKDFSNFKNIFDDEILLYEELLEELMCTKELFYISISKNIEKINHYKEILNLK